MMRNRISKPTQGRELQRRRKLRTKLSEENTDEFYLALTPRLTGSRMGFKIKESQSHDYDWLSLFMERETRFELATFSLATRHSTTELLPRMRSATAKHARTQFLVGKRRLELLRLAAPDPKSGVSTISPLAHCVIGDRALTRKSISPRRTQCQHPAIKIFPADAPAALGYTLAN